MVVPAGLCDDDVDGDARPIGDARDIGADEYGVPRPDPVRDLRVADAVAGSTLTATLRWTAPPGALTTTIRYAGGPLAEVDWPEALSLAEDLKGSIGSLTAAVPYDGSTMFFALKTQNAAGDWSALSNNAFWPVWLEYLPLTIR